VPATVVQAKVTGTAGSEDLADLAEAGIYTSYIDPVAAPFAMAEGAAEEGATALLLPRGVGFTQITVTKGGRRPARFAGRMPDDQPYTSGARALAQALRGGGYTFRNETLYGRTRNAQGISQNRGFVSGDVGFSRGVARFSSDLSWERRAGVGNRFPAGFRTGLAGLRATLSAIRYGQPAPGNLPAGIDNDDRKMNAKIELRDGDLPSTSNLIVHNLKLTRSGSGPVRVRVEPLGAANTESLRLSINAAKGTFSGTFIHPNHASLARPPLTSFSGVFKNQDGQGVFAGPTTESTTGRITILAQ
jgi:hypothetical protein